MPLDPRDASLAAWTVSIVATVGSLTYSGIGFLGITGLGLPPCEMCWYQRILMYPLVAILGAAYRRGDRGLLKMGFGFAIAGAALALYHSLIQYLPHLEAGDCRVGSCTAVLYKVAGLSIPNQSLIAFAAIAVACGWVIRAADASVPEGAVDADTATDA